MNPKQFVNQFGPQFLPRVYPRSYECPRGYPDLEEISYRLCAPAIVAAQDPQGKRGVCTQIEIDAYMIVAQLVARDMPTLFVTEALFNEVLTTDFSPGTGLENIPWLKDGLLFILPKGVLNSPQDGDCPFLAVAKFDANKPVSIPGTSCPECVLTTPGYNVVTGPLDEKDTLLFTGRVRYNTVPTLGHIKSGFLGKFSLAPWLETDSSVPSHVRRTEREFAEFLCEFAIKLVIYLLVRPAIIHLGHLVRPAHVTATKWIREVRTANILG